ncbi:MAG: hypothetical protein FJ294_11180 [Planctomycetes bacterium]|nr:hypothetical protein [Planctomycetota bacterium]
MGRWLELARRGALFAAGTAIGLHFAPQGFLPLDQSICFDGGWRILCGQVPLRDYAAPNGFPVHALQALFFAIFGVNWFAYCLHAALANGAATLLVDRLLDLLGLERRWSSVFALCTAFVFTPPFGVPYMETHAFLFSLAALYAALVAVRGESERARLVAALVVGPLLALAFLSKQIPSVLFLPAVLLVGLCAPRERARTLLRMLAGLAGAAGALLILAGVLGVDWQLVQLHVFDLPAEEGAKRLASVPTLASLGARFAQTRAELGLLTPAVALAGSLLFLLSLPLWRLRPRASNAPRAPLAAHACAALSLFLLFACLMFIAWTSNQKAIGVPLVFASVGCFAAACRAAALALAERGHRRSARVPALLLPFLAVASSYDAAHFLREFVATREVNDVAFDAQLAERSRAELPSALSFLRWSVPKLVTYTPADLAALVAYLREREGGLLVLGDCSPLYGLAGKDSTFPALWFHPALTFPSTVDPRFPDFESRLLANLERHDVRTLVLEPRIWVGDIPAGRLLALDAFPRLQALVDARAPTERTIGPFRILELAPR